MRALVVNGDDFGLTAGVNAGILDAHARGILTSASLFANAPATADAIAIARRTPTLGVGCHLTLVDGVPMLPSSELPTLAAGGRLRPTWIAFIRDVVLGRIQIGEIERELTAQVQRLVDAGLTLTHLDSHKHVHAYPPVFAIVGRIARRFGIPAVRVPCEPRPLTLVRRYARAAGPRRQAIENLALVPWAARDRSWLRRNGFPPAARFLGRALTGAFTPAALRGLVESLPEGTSELMMHPGYPDAALDRVRTRLREERAREVRLLIDPATLAAVAHAGIALVRHDRL
jgi:hopanoid biosynthesis associated protein HpnK